MEFEYNDLLQLIISLFGVVVAFLALRHADSARAIANTISYRSLKAASLQKYADFLAEKTNEISDIVEPLDELCRNVEETIFSCVYNASGKSKNGRKTHHILNDLTELLYKAFRIELPWQTAENLYRRITEVAYLKSNIGRQKPSIRKVNFEKEYTRFTSSALEFKLYDSEEFHVLLYQYYSAIKDESEILSEGLVQADKLFEFLKTNKPRIEGLILEIEKKKSKNRHEEIKLHENYHLLSELDELYHKLRFLAAYFLIESKLRIDLQIMKKDQLLLLCLYARVLILHDNWRLEERA